MKLSDIHPFEPCPVLKLSGKSKAVLDFIWTLAMTEPIETDPDWWAVKVLTMNWN